MFASRSKRGFNWVQGLQDIAYAINTSSTKVLGGLIPFEAYYGRSRTFSKERRSAREIRKTIRRANRRIHRSLMKSAVSPSKYKVGEKILIRYPFRKSRMPTKRYIVKGKVEAVKQNRNYLVAFKLPNKPELGVVRKWVGVENITSLTVALEKQRKTTNIKANQSNTEKQSHNNKYY
ncbi:hypothetical protein ACJMK2_005572 [Sinanodonta woodiana]|uniref:Uncharacterized protein n=1 Tax=Sinanodonta woodiana TaxID=1069815 RepID=A0ABD3VQI3_SINWO